MATQFARYVRLGLGLALGLGALILAARGASRPELSQAVSRGNSLFLGLALASYLVSPLAKAERWRWLFFPTRPSAGIGALASLVVIGQSVNFLVPGRWGELVRSYLGGEETGLSKAFVLGTVAGEKLLDVIMLAVVTLAIMPFVVLPAWVGLRFVPLAFSAALVALSVAVLIGGRSRWLRLADRVLSLLPAGPADRWHRRIAAGIDGLSALGSRQPALHIWGWTVLVWALAALTNLLLFVAFGLPASPVMALFLLVVLQGGVAVPSTPGKIGVFQYLCVIALSVFGVSASLAFPYAMVLYAIVIGSSVIWAALAIWRRSLSLRSLRRAAAGWR